MSTCIEQTAILIFSRTATFEAAVKTFDQAAGKCRNERIARRLIRETLATAHRTHLPVFLHSTPAQSTGSFGEKLANALESIFDKGYENVLVIGNDCPDISVGVLLAARRKLEENKLVLGPTTDGGVYLIGINRTAAYQRRKFIALPWEGDRLQAGWKKYSQKCDLVLDWLEPYSDIDQAADFKALLRRLPVWNPLRKQLVSILAASHRPLVFDQRKFPAAAPDGATPLRGPPFPAI